MIRPTTQEKPTHAVVECPNPGCDAVLTVSSKWIGKKGRCKKCNTPFAITEDTMGGPHVVPCPPRKEVVTATKPKKRRGRVVMFLLLLTALTMGALLAVKQFDVKAETLGLAQENVAAPQEQPPVVVNPLLEEEIKQGAVRTSVSELVDDHANQISAMKQWDNKRVVVTGVIACTKKSLIDSGTPYLKDPETGQVIQFHLTRYLPWVNHEANGFPIMIAANCKSTGKDPRLIMGTVLTSDTEIMRMQTERAEANAAAEDARITQDEIEVRAGPATVFTGKHKSLALSENEKYQKSRQIRDVIVAFTGSCRQVRQSKNGFSVVMEDDSETTVTCHFRDRHRTELETLKKDQVITVHGRLSHLWQQMNIELSSCVIVNK